MISDPRVSLSDVVGLLPDAAVAVGDDGRILAANAEAERLLGQSAADLVGTRAASLVANGPFRPPTTSPEPAASVELLLRRNDGTTFAAEATVSRPEAEDSSASLVVFRANASPAATAADLQRWLEAAPDAVLWLDADFVIVFANAPAERLFGYAREELVGRSGFDLLPEPDRHRPRRSRPEYFDGSSDVPVGEAVRVVAQRRDGSTFDADVALSSVQTEGGNLMWLAVRDVTARDHEALHRLEQEAGGIAHDFNNLLGVILNYSAFMARRLEGHPDAVDVIEPMRRAAERAAGLANRLFTIGSNGAAAGQAVDLAAVLRDAEAALRSMLGDHLRLAVGATTPALVHVERTRLEQLLVELAHTAATAVPQGETLRFDLTEERVAAHPTLAPARYARLRLEPFAVGAWRAAENELSVATIERIVNEAGGDLEATVVPGKPDTATVRLPLAADQARAVGGSEPVLVVDDSHAVREVARRILDDAGYRVVAAESAAAAIEAVEASAEPFRLLVSDVVMPGMSGPDLVRTLWRSLPDLSVVLMSGDPDPPLSPEERSDPRLSIVAKPFKGEELLGVVRKALDRGQPAR